MTGKKKLHILKLTTVRFSGKIKTKNLKKRKPVQTKQLKLFLKSIKLKIKVKQQKFIYMMFQQLK